MEAPYSQMNSLCQMQISPEIKHMNLSEDRISVAIKSYRFLHWNYHRLQVVPNSND